MGMNIGSYLAWGIDLSELSRDLQREMRNNVWRTDNFEIVGFGWEQAGAMVYVLCHVDYKEETGMSPSTFHHSLDKFPPPPDNVVDDLKHCVIDYVSDSDDDDIDEDDLCVQLHFGYVTG